MTIRQAVKRARSREEIKQDKCRRISEAARDLFISQGYDEATMRDIATRAGVALGTLFLYASNKRDLLFLVINDELEEAVAKADAGLRTENDFLQNVLFVFRCIYEVYGREPRLARPTLREMEFYESGTQAARFVAARRRLYSLCARSVRMAQERGEITSGESTSNISDVIIDVFAGEIRRWVANSSLDVAPGMRKLRKSIEIVVNGLSSVRSTSISRP